MYNLKAGKTDAAEGSVALFSQQTKDKGKKRGRRKHDLANVTCYGCRKKGHLKHKCLDNKDKKGKGKAKETGKGKTSSKNSGSSGTLYTAVSKTALLANTKLTNLYYIDSGASNHLLPSQDNMLRLQVQWGERGQHLRPQMQQRRGCQRDACHT